MECEVKMKTSVYNQAQSSSEIKLHPDVISTCHCKDVLGSAGTLQQADQAEETKKCTDYCCTFMRIFAIHLFNGGCDY